MKVHKKTSPIFLLVIVLLLAGCGSNSTDNGQITPTAPTTVSQAIATPAQEQTALATTTPQVVGAATTAPTSVPVEPTLRADVPVQPTPTDASTTVSPGGDGGSAQDAIISSLHTQAATRSLRGLSTTVGTSNPATMTIEVVRPERIHTTIDVGTFHRETINIGQTAYTKTPNGWVKSDTSGDMAALTTLNFIFADQSQVDAFVAENKDNWANAQLTGTDMVNGKSTKVYEFAVRVTTSMGDQTTITDSPLKLWIGESDNLPYRLQSSAELNLNGNDVTSTTTFSFSDYNADIKIEAPEVVAAP